MLDDPRMRSRRAFLSTGLKWAGGLAVAPGLITQDSVRPGIAAGTASGDVTGDRAIVWSRTDRPARMLVEWSTTESFRNVRRVRGPRASAAAGYTARVDLSDLPAGQRIFYRVVFEDLADSRDLSLTANGSFLSAPREAGDVRFAWSADTVGQGWGINEAWGGLRMYETMRRSQPDFFVHTGDTIYADAPLPPEMRLPDGTIWRNLVTPAKSKVAETIDEFRGNYDYNLLDEHLRRFNAEVAQVVVWDDHEVKNNWYPGRSLEDDDRYAHKDARALAADARQAFLEYSPIRPTGGGPATIYRACAYGPLLDVFAIDLRSYRGPNSTNRQSVSSAATEHAGRRQVDWLKRGLRSSRATWKVIASSLPIGLAVRDEAAYDAIANADAGPPLGRELEIAELLRFIQHERIRNVVWITGDVHYAAAHHYDPQRARFKEFDPFWEFVGGPIHAGTGSLVDLDGTFGPEVRFSAAPPQGLANAVGPAAGLQFFGQVRIAARSRVMTVSLHNLAGDSIHATDIEPQP